MEAVPTTNVQVAVRCRPVNAEERRTQQATAVSCDSGKKEVTVSSGPAGKKTTKTFTFDKVFGMYSTQEEVFESIVRPIVDEVLAGFNCTIFAYGQTGTGKTHTMEGDINSEEHAGIVPRSVKTILETLEASGSEFTIRVSFLELYNEELQDLLVPPANASEKKLKLCEDTRKGVVCQNLEEVTVMSVSDIFEILQRGIKQRATAATLCNKNSSRSHSIFTMKIMIKECSVDGEEVVRHGQLNLVDLAGSECVGRSGAKNAQLKEAGSINQSLLTLGRVITALVDHHGHIPYRDSKLTRLLQESLGGKAKTCIIATLSPAAMAVEESMSTLDYAHRAKNIKNAPQLNQRLTKKVVLKEYCAEIETLRAQLQLTREKNGIYVDPSEFYAMEARLSSQESQLVDCESALRTSNDQVKVLRADKDELNSQLGETNKALGIATSQLHSAETSLQVAHAELCTTQVELSAAEAVVNEQTDTETRLFKQGSELQSEVGLRRGERDALLNKVDRLVTAESARLASAQDFAGDVTSSKEALLSGVSAQLASNQQQSTELCEGVMEMLHRGKDTCSTLQGSIDAALKVLVSDAESAKEGVSASCGELQIHLRDTNSQLAQALVSMQSALGEWLGEVDVGIKAAVERLAAQQRLTAEAETAVEKQAREFAATAERYVAEQAAQSAAAVESAETFRRELNTRLEEHQRAVAESAEKARESVANKAAAMEKAMKSLLQDLVGDASSDFSAVAATSGQLCRDTRALGDSHADAAHAQQQAAVELATAHATATRELAASGLDIIKVALSSATEAGAAADAELGSISTAVEGKRTQLEHTVSAVCADAAKAIDEGCQTVRKTSEDASSILGRVSAAAENMNTSASEAMASFGQFLDTKGADVCAGVGSHFAALGDHLAKQNHELEGLGVRAETFATESAGSAVRPTGQTPRKVEGGYAAIKELVSTRAHETIKAEVRSGTHCKASGSEVHSDASSSMVLQESEAATTETAAVNTTTSAVVADASSEATLSVADVKIEVTGVATAAAHGQSKENAGPNPLVAPARPTGLFKGLTRSKSASVSSSTTGGEAKEGGRRAASTAGN